jgi:FkbM family methyltransferase
VSNRLPTHEVGVRLRRVLRARGLDVVRYPVDGSLWALLERIFRSRGVGCVLDVGAHVGEFGGFLREHGYCGEIVSFEPVPCSYRSVAGRAAGDARWRVYPYALGAVEGSRNLGVAYADNLSSFLEPAAAGRARFAGAIDARERVDVEVRRLESIFTEVTAAAGSETVFLKCDTQGLDLEVVQGAGNFLSGLAGVQLELDIEPLYEGSGTFLDGLAQLGSYGFRLAGVFPVARDDRTRLLQVETVFVPST